jgi:hypothetical protein
LACENVLAYTASVVSALGAPAMSPTCGMIGMSPFAPEQPTPLTWVRLKPRIRVAVYW